MYEYKFTYRKINGVCFHCEKLKSRFKFKKLIDSLFRSKKIAKIAKKECQFEWKSILVAGHGLDKIGEGDIDNKTMVLYLKDGSLMTIRDWQSCELKLGTDWVIATKKNMEAESGQNVKLNTRDI